MPTILTTNSTINSNTSSSSSSTTTTSTTTTPSSYGNTTTISNNNTMKLALQANNSITTTTTSMTGIDRKFIANQIDSLKQLATGALKRWRLENLTAQCQAIHKVMVRVAAIETQLDMVQSMHQDHQVAMLETFQLALKQLNKTLEETTGAGDRYLGTVLTSRFNNTIDKQQDNLLRVYAMLRDFVRTDTKLLLVNVQSNLTLLNHDYQRVIDRIRY
ncbi:uncharacterized protein LOC128965250 [Oppia nitens]|uniref:uncharacterized protein LOC128965250 n=1 Tax=Oppia nitens TaxID=1686743 RepID=UPI0023D9D4C9|nr:uncharacterized protein LOC128965250 [Oppia nitens]